MTPQPTPIVGMSQSQQQQQPLSYTIQGPSSTSMINNVKQEPQTPMSNVQMRP
ncbi:unnamed protein product, partial [Rotaria magnacalcarata]